MVGIIANAIIKKFIKTAFMASLIKVPQEVFVNTHIKVVSMVILTSINIYELGIEMKSLTNTTQKLKNDDDVRTLKHLLGEYDIQQDEDSCKKFGDATRMPCFIKSKTSKLSLDLKV